MLHGRRYRRTVRKGLCDAVGIVNQERRRFDSGDEACGIWEWIPNALSTPCDLPAITRKTILVSAFLSARIIPAGDSDALLHGISGLPLVP